MQVTQLYDFLASIWHEQLNAQAVDIVMMHYQEEIVSMMTLLPEKRERVDWLKEGF